METGRNRAISRNVMRLVEKMRSKRYRESYIGAHIRQFLARQMRTMRGDLSQAEFGQIIGKPQNVVSRFEDPYYGKWTLSSLLDVAARTNRALIVRFVDYPTFLKFTHDQSEDAASPEPYKKEKLDRAAYAITSADLAKRFLTTEIIQTATDDDSRVEQIGAFSNTTSTHSNVVLAEA